MKNTRICPKCNGSDIIKIDGKTAAYGALNYIPAGISSISVTRYLCCTCGYSEEWVDRENLPKLKKKYDK